MNFGGAFSAFSQIPIDWMIVGVFFVIVTADAMRAGSVRAAALAISFTVSSLLFQMLHQTVVIGPLLAQFSNTIAQLVIFAVLELVVFVCVHQMLFGYDRYTSLVSSIVSGLAATIVVLVIWTQTPALQSAWHFDSQMISLFSPAYSFLWILCSYLALAFIGS